MKKIFMWLVLGLIVLFAIVGVFWFKTSGFLYFNYYILHEGMPPHYCDPGPCTPVPITSDTDSWKTYTSTQYGFSFSYPGTWKVSEKTDAKGHVYVDLSSGVYSEPQLPSVPTEEIKFSVVDKNYFNPPIPTKVGLIGFDSKLGALVDTENSDKCLLPKALFGVNNDKEQENIFLYDTSLMSDPAHAEYALLTKSGKIILITNLTEVSPDQTIESKISSSFTLLNGDSVVVPDCALGED